MKVTLVTRQRRAPHALGDQSSNPANTNRFCPRCKVNRRASKTLTLVRLPPVLLIQLKRFIPVNGGRFWNKSETPVIFPLTNLDLSRYVPVRQPTGTEDLDDPRTQIGPFKYDLYGVSNHMGTLSSGHCEWSVGRREKGRGGVC